MNIWDILILAGVAAAAVLAVLRLRKRGRRCCDGCCAACRSRGEGCGSCDK
ncbi:MAG: hypothetical protein IKH77_09950 [Clostridia bacterium]|nr:hypothetical protein [Clostridia bacterium]